MGKNIDSSTNSKVFSYLNILKLKKKKKIIYLALKAIVYREWLAPICLPSGVH